jgi:hypothetical protein
MKRLALLSLMAGAMWAGACHAAEPSLCKSMCDADKRECRAHVRELAGEDGGALLDMPEKNPLARAVQVQVPTEASRAIDNAGTQARRMGQAGACDATYLRCTRACAAPPAPSVAQPAAGHRDGA